MENTIISDKEAYVLRRKWTDFYNRKYYNLWIQRFSVKGVTKQQELYIKRMFWTGTLLGAFKALSLDKSFLGGLPPKAQEALTDNVAIGFAPFVTSQFSQYDYPAVGLLVNVRASPYIPKGNMIVGKDVVITRTLDDGSSFGSLVSSLINNIVDLEMSMRKNRLLAVGSCGVEVGADSPTRANELAKKILSDEAICAFEGGETRQIAPFSGGAQYLVDKLRTEKESRESELKTLLGIDTLATEKKERLVKKEAESREAETEVSKAIYMKPLKAWFKEIGDVLGFKLELVDNFKTKNVSDEKGEEKDEKENDKDIT